MAAGTTGLNYICAGDHINLTATGGNGSYTWSPNVGLSATSGAVLVASPLVTTTYTVASTNPNNSSPTTASITVTVSENCCPTSYNVGYIVPITGSLFNAGTGSPFAGYPAGTRFHFTGSSPIIFSGLAVQPPMGSVILMDANKDIYLQDGASLSLAGVSITAACNEMWGKLWVRNTAAGISSTFTDGAPGLPTTSTQLPVGGTTTLKNQISHSLGGIEVEQPVSVTGNVPYFKLTNVDFLHNEQSLKLFRDGIPQLQPGSGSASPSTAFVTLSTFNSNPGSFKSPRQYGSADINYPHYSQYHVWFVGNGGDWQGNTMQNALFGFHSPDNAQPAALVVSNTRFANIYLAGINVNTSDDSGSLGYVYSYSSTYDFPTLPVLPSTPQLQYAVTNDVRDGVTVTRGIYSYGSLLLLSDNTFRQASDPYSSFGFTERYKQVGAKCRRLGAAAANQFTLLHTGIELSEMYFGAIGFESNTFTACRRGIEATGVGVSRSTATSPPPLPPTVTFGLRFSCNTFDRGSDSRPGLAYGIVLLQGATATFDPLPAPASGTPPLLTNKFLDWATGRTGFQAIFNASRVAPQDVQYSTYDNYVNQVGLLGSTSRLRDLCTGVTFPQTFQNYNPGQPGGVCGLGNPGLERHTSTGNGLAQNNPNPASEYTAFTYHVQATAKKAELRILRGLDNTEICTRLLPLTGNSYELQLHGWPEGLYFATLYVDGVPVQTRRLLVR